MGDIKRLYFDKLLEKFTLKANSNCAKVYPINLDESIYDLEPKVIETWLGAFCNIKSVIYTLNQYYDKNYHDSVIQDIKKTTNFNNAELYRIVIDEKEFNRIYYKLSENSIDNIIPIFDDSYTILTSTK